VVNEQFFEHEEETVVVEALEGRGARDNFGHKVVVLKFDSLGGLWPDAVHVQDLDKPPVSCVVLGDRDFLEIFIYRLSLIIFESSHLEELIGTMRATRLRREKED
jgi:hypothetical protein